MASVSPATLISFKKVSPTHFNARKLEEDRKDKLAPRENRGKIK